MRCGGKLVSLTIVAMVIAGCGPSGSNRSAKTPQSKNSKSQTVKPAPAPPVEEKVDPNAFSSVDAALAAIVKGTEEQRTADINKAERWLGDRGSSAHAQLAATVRNESEHLAARIASCRVLARAGDVATPLLMEITAPGYKPDQLRQNGAQLLGMVKPYTKANVDRLAELAQDQDGRIRVAALRAMEKIGPDVKKLRPDLVVKLRDTYNNVKEEETIRTQALATLKKVEPRHGFSGMGKIEK